MRWLVLSLCRTAHDTSHGLKKTAQSIAVCLSVQCKCSASMPAPEQTQHGRMDVKLQPVVHHQYIYVRICKHLLQTFLSEENSHACTEAGG